MRRFSEYTTVIFDCDGVIFDSNSLKVDAMGKALLELGFSYEQVLDCQRFFSENFGKSRFYHIDNFLENYLHVEESSKDGLRAKILAEYSTMCHQLYMTAEQTPFVDDLLQKIQAAKYIASGSEQEELRTVIKARGLSQHFEQILGSPREKSDIVADVVNNSSCKRCVLIGDARSDLEAANTNSIDFIYYSPFSNVDSVMRALCEKGNHRIVDSFEELIEEL